ncbi:(4Fe-4S)-binding protein [Clostridium carboxidivorans P7]|uniref:Nitrite and sulphite reductase 4Fe-4S region n=1 Tax=Clostridium carboxidivorans P7 TaxID=536227 RepID=C6PVH6_9CLOT|nr:4Fe-4S binding protein [Clostridium carboxidivorans]AKN29695.1 (4Fe-4S)-binding protein [Clostridium carboxidivorans P7]EET86741.1 nitrite and sulphite reductase 4Fe-4S region [Clostridium carboxidivorans P7]EFG89367.1 4Fe-4S binding domain protein [Clostridium carboxidivorans P7]
MNKEKLAQLKLEGFINQRDTRYFTLRIIAVSGIMSSSEMNNVLSIANIYGRGYISFTTRLGIEIPWIREEDIESVKEDLRAFNLRAGGTGKKVRPIVSCKGTVCTHGLIDTQKLCAELHKKYFAHDLPAKFKIGIVGCPNNCAKTQLNDLGFMGQRLPKFEESKCKACGACVKVCKAGALDKVEGKTKFNEEKCLGCGKCINACHFDAMETKKEGVAVFLGGKFGRKYKIGDKLQAVFSLDEIEEVTQKVMDCYAENGNGGERFGDMIDRIGIENLKAQLLNKL